MSDGNYPPPPDDEARKLGRGIAFIEAFRSVEPSMSANYAVAFMAVALRPGLGVTAYAKQLGLTRPGASRVLGEIGQRTRAIKGGAGLGLVDSVPNAEDRRNVEFFLTPKGKRLLGQVLAHIGR
ncbi:MAG TPA: hypothetical protein VIL69_23180 [Roseomonas sp.]|jgi:DNA-binding MarR family transcriptional regulator